MHSNSGYHSETRWSRYSKVAEGVLRYHSRLADGSATITLDELNRAWHSWSRSEQIDFCMALSTVARPSPDILRFLIQNGDHDTCSTIAVKVARELPPEESVPVLRKWCETCKVGRGANYFQAIVQTRSPEARAVLQQCFARIWNSEGLMDDADFVNWAAADAMWCIKSMLELDEDPEPLRKMYETLENHPCQRTRTQTRRWLAPYFEYPS